MLALSASAPPCFVDGHLVQGEVHTCTVTGHRIDGNQFMAMSGLVHGTFHEQQFQHRVPFFAAHPLGTPPFACIY